MPEKEETAKFDVINDGASLRVTQPIEHTAVYNREEVLKTKAGLETELSKVERILSVMDEMGVK